jgi:subtilisin family serine protease
MKRIIYALLVTLSLLLQAQTTAQNQTVSGATEKVLIRIGKPYNNVVAKIESLGGRVKHQYKYIDAIAAEVPWNALTQLRREVGANAITRDVPVQIPEAAERKLAKSGLTAAGSAQVGIPSEGAVGLAVSSAGAPCGPQASAYSLNNSHLNLCGLHAGGKTGAGVIVAVIDSGLRPGFPHLSLDGSVIGCEDFINDGMGCSNENNHPHGTLVAGLISSNAVFRFSPDSPFRNSVLEHCPGCFSDAPANTEIPMIGSAPLASIYMLRVLGLNNTATSSDMLQAIERVIELREKYDAGQPGGVKIQIANISISGRTLFAGRDLIDKAAEVMLDKDIILTTVAGNYGPSSLTVGHPGTAFETLTVGAASEPQNERILRDVQYWPGIGALYRPSAGIQTAAFGSRGPTADGRMVPDVIASGYATYVQGESGNNDIDLVSGTSCAAPSVAGVAAVLRQTFPAATARQIRNAILLSANSDLVADDSTELDQGEGFVDAQAAAALLAAGNVPNTSEKPRNPRRKVAQNVQRGTFLEPLKGNVQKSISGIKPGERAEFLYEVKEKTSRVTITISNFVSGSTQNALFGDDILIAVHSAKTSYFFDYDFFGFTRNNTFVIDDPEPGLLRVTVNGDWTNASPISADVAITSVMTPTPRTYCQRHD